MLDAPFRTTTPLSEWLKLNPSLRSKPTLGRGESTPQAAGPGGSTALQRRESMVAMEAAGLPFLFKILSVRTALSIQAHPDRALARRLHAARPDLYKDDNHKPEMCIAISQFESLCTFRKPAAVVANVRACPELAAIVGEAALAQLAAAADKADDSPEVKEGLRRLFTNLMTADTALVEKSCEALNGRIVATPTAERSATDALAARVYAQYPKDVGVFSCYLLNYRVLQPGEALYLGANEPHAYISGECAECMATSDNVVRAGCTPKFKDVETLLSMLTYKAGEPHVVNPVDLGDGKAFRYSDYPSTEFMLDRLQIGARGEVGALPAVPGVSIVIVVDGAATVEESAEGSAPGAGGLTHEVHTGSVFMVCPGTQLRVRGDGDTLLAFRACAKY